MAQLRDNRERVRRFFADELPAIGHHTPEATYLAWLDCSALQLAGGPQQFFLEHARVALNDGAEFGPPGRGHVRLNFATSGPILDEILDAHGQRRSAPLTLLHARVAAMACSYSVRI